MKSILKQFFKTIFKKSFLMIAFLMAFFVMIGTVSIGTFTLNSIVISNNKINNEGNSTNIIFEQYNDNLNINYTSPILEDDYIPEISTTKIKAFNINNLDPKNQELTVFPISPKDFEKLSDKGLKNTWAGTPANNENFLSIDPEYFNSKFITSASLPMFTFNNVYGYNLSHENENGEMEVFLDPRQINLIPDLNNPNKFLINGFYDDFQLTNGAHVLESFMVVSDPSLPYEPKSLLGTNIRKAGIHRNANSFQKLSSTNNFWNKNSLDKTLSLFFESMPDITNGDLRPDPKSGIPFIEFQDSIEINLKLDEPTNPLVKLYLSQLNDETINKVLNKKIYMTPFQASNGLYEEIPKNNNHFLIFKDNLNKYVLNFIQNSINELTFDVNSFKDKLILESLNDSDWTVSESIQKTNNDNNYLFSSRELSNLNSIVLNEGKQLYSNKENIEKIYSLDDYYLNNLTFDAYYNSIKLMSGFQKFVNGKPVFDSIIYDSNKNLNLPPYPGSVSSLNPEGVIPTEKSMRLLKEILNDMLIEFEKIDNDISLNFLNLEEYIGLTQEEIDLKINQKKIFAITNTPIFYEYQITFNKAFSNKTYISSLNIYKTFYQGKSFSPIDESISSIFTLNFDNYGVVVSSAYFESNNLKILSESTINEVKTKILNDILKNPQNPEEIINLYLDSIPPEYKIDIGDKEFFIVGSGDAPDFIAPIISLDKPLPNKKNEAVVFVNASQMSSIKGNWSNSILSNRTINIKSNSNRISSVNSKIDELNNFFNNKFSKLGDENPFKIYLNSSFLSNPSVQTLRWSQPILTISLFTSIIIIISLILLLIITYILIILIKFIFEILGFSISVARANGIPRRKIIFAISLILAGFSVSLSLLVFIASYFAAPLFFSIISSFWFVPISLPSFPIWGLPVVFLASTTLVYGFVFIISWQALKKPILLTLNGNDIVKMNKLSKISRSTKINLSALSKLRISMLSSKIGKISLISVLMGLSFGIISSTFGLTLKLEESYNNNLQTKNYSYALDLLTPSYQTGMIKVKNYLAAGEIDPRNGVESILKNSLIDGKTTNPYYSLLYDQHGKVIPNSLLAKRIVLENTSPDNTTFPKTTPIFYSNNDYLNIPNDSNSYFKTYENITLPSVYMYNELFSQNITLGFDSFFLAEILDIDIGAFAGINIGNLWKNHVSKRLPFNLVALISSSINEYRKSILKKYPWYNEFLILENQNEKYSSKNLPKEPLSLNVDTVFDKSLVRFTDKYLEALGVFLGDEELFLKNNIWSNNYLLNNLGDETYTYVNSDLILNNNEKFDIKLMGIKDNSEHIYLRSSKGQNLNNLISANSNNLIINKGAAYKYNLEIGSKVKIIVKNDYYGLVKDLIEKTNKDIHFDNKEIVLTVAGISTDSVGETFWINQELANNLTNLNYGDFVTKISPLTTENIYVERKRFEPIIDINTGDIIIENQFNGFFSKSENLNIGNTWIPFASMIGVYPLSFETYNIIQFRFDKNALFNTLASLFSVPYDQNNLATLEIYNKIQNVDSTFEMEKYIKDNFTDSQIFVDKLTELSYWNLTPSAIGLDGRIISDQIFNLISTNSRIATILTGVIFLPILLVTVMVSMLSLADNFNKTLTILRILGMNKRTTISTIIIIYIPILILGIALSFLIVFLINNFFQSILYSTLSIYISSNINIISQWVSFLAMLFLILTTILIMIIILVREKFELSIKF